jgi:hypothetical protein
VPENVPKGRFASTEEDMYKRQGNEKWFQSLMSISMSLPEENYYKGITV